MKIIKKITVKQLLTESSKSKLRAKFQNQKDQLLKECEQLRFEKKKLEKNKKGHVPSIGIQVEKEIEKRTNKIKIIEFQLEQLDILSIGSELKESEVDAIMDVQVGDSWGEFTKDTTIIVKDGIVHDIQ